MAANGRKSRRTCDTRNDDELHARWRWQPITGPRISGVRNIQMRRGNVVSFRFVSLSAVVLVRSRRTAPCEDGRAEAGPRRRPMASVGRPGPMSVEGRGPAPRPADPDRFGSASTPTRLRSVPAASARNTTTSARVCRCRARVCVRQCLCAFFLVAIYPAMGLTC